jgi:hypothetical protein
MSFSEDCDLVAVVPKLNVVADIKRVRALFAAVISEEGRTFDP